MSWSFDDGPSERKGPYADYEGDTDRPATLCEHGNTASTCQACEDIALGLTEHVLYVHHIEDYRVRNPFPRYERLVFIAQTVDDARDMATDYIGDWGEFEFIDGDDLREFARRQLRMARDMDLGRALNSTQEDPQTELLWGQFCNQWIVVGVCASPLGDEYLADLKRKKC